MLNDATAALPAKPGERQAPFVLAEQQIDLPLAAAWLRVAVRDTLNDRTGTIEIPLPLKPEPKVQAVR